MARQAINFSSQAAESILDSLGMDRSGEDFSPELDDDLAQVPGDDEAGDDEWEDADDDEEGAPLPQDDVDDDEGSDLDLQPIEPQRQPDQRLRTDQRGNLVDAQGRIVARAGPERRFYEQLQSARKDLQQRDSELRTYQQNLMKAVNVARDLNTRYQAMKEQGSAASRAGLSDQEHHTVLEFAKAYKANPLQAIKGILTRAAADGIDIQALSGSGLDVHSLSQTLLEQVRGELQPLKQFTEQQQREREQQQEQARIQREAEDEVASFINSNPDVVPYLPVIKQLNSRFPNASLNELWLHVQLYLSQNPKARRNPKDPSSRRSRPNGKGRVATSGKPAPIAKPEVDYDEIVNNVLDEAGIKA